MYSYIALLKKPQNEQNEYQTNTNSYVIFTNTKLDRRPTIEWFIIGLIFILIFETVNFLLSIFDLSIHMFMSKFQVLVKK